MSRPTGIHRFPRAHIDPIVDPATALSLFRRALAVPRRHETVIVLLDDRRCGFSIVTVDGTDEPDHVLGAIECFTHPPLVENGLDALLVATDRTADGGTEPGDADRWFEMCDLTDQAGVELVEWFVFGRTISCPRDLVGAPPRWRGLDARSA
ncbi:hypothetical protein BDK89_3187 [Ilumatobacter fluminis]|uniref:Uncharacterized protein n=1 Tax=Ilumatobacter fluminis TaxID=467091 RepID=A0A4R7I4E8_9ACTN|nr:hypothetical protein [Ilumatobacter fluminis]TDT17576.1 hypothetical protein BDK89_3187 [Ilumatobacter fluminis]